MPTPEFILQLRASIGHDPLWLSGASAVVLRGTGDQTEVLLVQRSDNGAWTVVCGIVEPEEPPQTTAVRECLEETGVAIEVERLVLTGVVGPNRYPNGDVTSYLDHTFRCRPVDPDIEPRVGDDESRAAGWFRLDALPEPISRVQRRRIQVAVANPDDVLLAGHQDADDF